MAVDLVLVTILANLLFQLKTIYPLQIGKIMFLFKVMVLPQDLNRIFVLNSQIHCHYTIKLFHIPKLRTDI